MTTTAGTGNALQPCVLSKLRRLQSSFWNGIANVMYQQLSATTCLDKTERKIACVACWYLVILLVPWCVVVLTFVIFCCCCCFICMFIWLIFLFSLEDVFDKERERNKDTQCSNHPAKKKTTFEWEVNLHRVHCVQHCNIRLTVETSFRIIPPQQTTSLYLAVLFYFISIFCRFVASFDCFCFRFNFSRKNVRSSSIIIRIKMNFHCRICVYVYERIYSFGCTFFFFFFSADFSLLVQIYFLQLKT